MHLTKSVLYTLPKIHKKLRCSPGCLIINGINSLPEPFSKYVDSFIKSYVHELPSFIKNAMDFISKINSILYLPANLILVTFDIEILYTNIPHNESLDTLSFFLQSCPSDSTPPSQFIVDLAAFVLKYN